MCTQMWITEVVVSWSSTIAQTWNTRFDDWTTPSSRTLGTGRTFVFVCLVIAGADPAPAAILEAAAEIAVAVHLAVLALVLVTVAVIVKSVTTAESDPNLRAVTKEEKPTRALSATTIESAAIAMPTIVHLHEMKNATAMPAKGMPEPPATMKTKLK